MSVPVSQFGNMPDLFSPMAQWGGSSFQPAVTNDPGMTAFQQQYLDILGQQNRAPSAWQTGAQTFGNVAQGLMGLGNIYLGWQGLQAQKDAFKFNKGVTNTNLNNSITDYNRRLTDTLNNRALNNGQGDGWVSSQLAKYQAKRSY